MKRFLVSDLGLSAIVMVLLSMVVMITHAQAPTVCPPGVTSATVKANTPFTLLWCSPATDSVTGANAYGLSTTPVALQSVSQVGSAFSDGLVQMKGIVPAQPKGHYTFTVRAVNSTGEGGASAPFDLGAVDPMPTAPVNLRVQ
jgi:hypothetical protein